MAKQWTTNTTANANTTIGPNTILANGTGNIAIGSGIYSGTSSTLSPQKVTYHVLGENIEVSGYYDTNLVMIISILNVLKKPYYDELKKNKFKFPEEIENCLRIGFRDNLIDEIMKPTF